MSGRAIAGLLLAVTVAAPGAARAQSPAGPRALNAALEGVAARVTPTVAQIRVTSYAPVVSGTGGSSAAALLGTARRSGSGVVLSPDGYIITNAHVVEGGRRFVAVLDRPAVPGNPGHSAVRPVPEEVPAQLVGSDRETDLALLKVDLSGLPFATLGDSDSLAQGRMVLAFGSPLGLNNSVTMGVVSAVGRQLHDEDRMLYIQTDTPINPGNSGGPLVDLNGMVVGINTLIASQSGGSEGIGFAAPSNIVRHVYEQLRQWHRVRRGEIGVFAQTVTPALAAGLRLPREWGVVLGDVCPGGPADRAGLRQGDMIYSLDGKPMENGRQFDVNLYRKPIGQPVTLEVVRGPQHVILRVPVVERRDEADPFRDLVTPEKNLIPRLGVLGLDLTPELAQIVPGVRAPHGIVIAAVAGDAVADFEPGDAVYGLNGAPVAGIEQLRTQLAALPPGQTAVLQVGRQGQLRFLTVTLE
jgi:serine protease Do